MYIITTPNQLTAGALVIQYWVDRDKINPGVFIAIFWVAIVCINYFGIKFFGEFEFWLSSIKVVVLVGLIILSLILALGGGPNHDRTGFRESSWDSGVLWSSLRLPTSELSLLESQWAKLRILARRSPVR